MDIFEILCQFKNQLSPNDFDSLCKQLYTNDPSTYSDQVSIILSRSNAIPADEVETFLNLVVDPAYSLKVSRVAAHFDLLHQAQQCFPAASFGQFVDCFEFERPNATYPTVMANLMKWNQVAPQHSEKLGILLEQHFGQLDAKTWIETLQNQNQQQQQQHTSYPTAHQFAPGMESLMQQAYKILHDNPYWCQQFTGILDADQMNGLPFAESIMNIYQWVQNVDPDLWYPLATVLEQMQTLQESASDKYESYEDFVQKNFLDDEGQEYLDGEIEQARVQHLFSNMSM